MAEFKKRKKYHVAEENDSKGASKYIKKNYDYREVALTKMGKRQLMLTLVSIFAVTFLAIGSSFAIFTTSVKSSDYNVIKVGTLNIDFGSDANDTISLADQYPLTDEEGLLSEPYTFTITNTGTLTADYTISLIDDDDMITQDGCSGNLLNKNYIKYSIDGGDPRILGSGDQIATDTLESGGEKIYTLRVWLGDNALNDAIGKHFHGKIVVNATNQTGELVAGSLQSGVGEEGEINSDDSSQTFIAGVNPDNYVWYSGKLWRVVSIDPKDNSVKLVTQWNVASIPYSNGDPAFQTSYAYNWLNDTSVDGFLGNLREPEKFIKMDAVWNATTATSDDSKPQETTMVTAAVGLLNSYEFKKSFSLDALSSYLWIQAPWWTLSPENNKLLTYIYSNGSIGSYEPQKAFGLRPSIVLKPSVRIAGGDGTIENPYRLSGDNDTNLSGTMLSERYSGEYVRFGTGENTLYRIVSHETKGLTKITSAMPLKSGGDYLSSAYGRSNDFSSSVIKTFLNGTYLTNYITSDQRNMIEENTTWYTGTVGYGSSYVLAKYANGSTTTLASSTMATVGLLRVGELLASEGVVDGSVGSTGYWLMNPYDSSSMNAMTLDYGGANLSSSSASGYVKPALNLKQNVIITGGTGTQQDPFEIALS